MKSIIPILTITFVFMGEVWAQDNLDFLDKVNEKPKSTTTSTTVTKPKEETSVSTKKSLVTSKKKKSKKKNLNSLTSNSTNTSNSTTTNTTTNNITPQTNTTESKILPVVETQTKQEEDVALRGLWMEPEVIIEPDGLPGFASDLSFGRTQSVEGVKEGVQTSTNSKPLFSFSDFFEKYKKAMLILGIIILFAFYRLRIARPSSSSRPYRR